MTDTDIRQLDDDTVARIAAGEVVERPASAVKELVENSLDADASRIEVTIESGGTDLIRVADDGRGMTEADLRAAVRQHTTSKIASLKDLESGVATLGFRGEALHTIGSVSRMTVRSRPRADTVSGAEGGTDDDPATGTELVYEGGEVVAVDPAGCPEGTVVEIEDLFYNTPARRKFLKTTATEFAHVNRVVTRYALANPAVAIALTHDGREVFATTGQGDLQAAVLAVYGRDVARSMITVEEGSGESDDGLPPGPVASVSGVVSHPETNRSTREYLATYVNGRAVTADAVREGIMRAYGTQLGGDRYPFVVLFLDVPGDAVDVNVHPRKREVRFDDEDAVRRQVESAVKDALLDHGLLRSRAPRGRSAPEEATIEPERAEDGRDVSDTRRENDRTVERTDESGTNQRDRAGPTDATSQHTASVDTTDQNTADVDTTSEDTADVDTTSEGGIDTDGTANPEEPPATESTDQTNDGHGPGENEGTNGSKPAIADARRSTAHDSGRRDSHRKFDAGTEQRTLGGEAATDDMRFESLPPLRILGQLHDTYLVCETADGLALVDQHAADERVNYERLREAFATDATAQALASPVELELTAAEAEAFAGYREALSRLGFYADRVDERTVAVTTVPAVLEETIDPDRLRDVLSSFVAGDRDAGSETVDALADEFLGDLACHPSITGNTSLTEGSVVDLLAALDDCENPYACPHGRPVIVQLDESEIEDRFERDYPGHGG